MCSTFPSHWSLEQLIGHDHLAHFSTKAVEIYSSVLAGVGVHCCLRHTDSARPQEREKNGSADTVAVGQPRVRRGGHASSTGLAVCDVPLSSFSVW